MQVRFIFLLFFLIICQTPNAQNITGKPGTVLFFREGYPLSFPAIDLSGSDFLELRFDIFGSTKEIFTYTVELCDFDWTPVKLDKDEYLKGYPENPLNPFASSINTTVDYIHYRLNLPNEDISFLRSGNYILTIYRDNEKDKPVLTEKFIIYESEIDIEADVDKYRSEQLGDKQELLVDVNPKDVSIHALAGNLKLSVMQNNDWSTRQIFEQYSTDSRQHLMFNIPGQIVFPGVSEFRWFDMKSLKFFSERVERVDYIAPFYNIFLKPDKLRGDKEYFSNADFNGLFYIGNQESHDDDTLDADYAIVHFQLETGMPLPYDIYIEGAITGWQHTDNYMEFDPERGMYFKDLFLKQGLYNYRYITHEYNTKLYEQDITEGNHYQTSNSYLIIVYYRPLGDIYFKPAGVTILESKM